MPPSAPVHAVVEVVDAAHRLPLPRPDDVTWVYRHGVSAAASTRLVAALARLDLPGEPGVAYVAGEARTCQLARRHLLRERGWPRASVLVHAFWSAGSRPS
ncbi:siderophore-interacting protein [Actinomycetes bacterium KLBMP 9797]